MTSKQSFRSWCRNLPEPYAYVFDGEKILLGKGAHRFSTVEAAIRAKDPDQCDAVDKEGAIIRTYVFRSTREEDDEEPREAPTTGDAKTLHHFASLLSGAYKQGAQDHAQAYKETFGQVVKLAEAALARVQGLEKLLNQMLKDVRVDAMAAREELEEVREEILEAQQEAAAAGSGAKGGLVEALVKSRLAGVVNGVAGAGTNAGTNGATQ
jgi:hypothetical protein